MPARTQQEEHLHHNLCCGFFALSHSLKESADSFGLSQPLVSYWKKKATEPKFRCNKHGEIKVNIINNVYL